MADLSRQCHLAATLAAEQFPALSLAGATDADMMVTLETIVTVGILFMERVYGVDRKVSAERLELMVERVMERIAAQSAKEASHGR